MRYPLVPLVNELTFPLLFFWFCLPFVILLIVIIIWLQLLLNEAQLPSTEELKKHSSDEPDSDSRFEDGPTEEENQNNTSSTGMEEEMQSGGFGGRLRPKPAYLSSNPKSQKQSLFAVISDSWSQSQKIRYSHTEKSNFCNIMMLLCTMLSSLTWNFACHLLQISNVLLIQLLPSSLIIYVAQLFVLLGEKVVKILGSLRLEGRGLWASFWGRKQEQIDDAPKATSGGK
ncbi:PREDICTED: adipogenin [Apaloderma vittatum]|uniref:adipogenin n=1 Tax=Apaloderma vittatum TaxID=57397 RepID=UPI0005216E1B|nr:PREDICTED: adipogenin [Apaloderma vittatum]